MMTEKIYCIKCQKELPNFENFIQILFVVTDKQIIYINTELVLDYVNFYLEEHPSHLSASEILLVRTDIVTEVLKLYYSELKYWGFTTIEVCEECYKIYAKDCPLL